MKKVAIIFTLICFLIFSNSCKKEELSSTGNLKFSNTEKSLLLSTNSFGISLFKQLGSTSTTNLFLSPLSISLDFTMAFNGAHTNTAYQMQQVLGYSQLSNLAINQSCQSLIQMLENADPSVTMLIANSIWYRNTFTVKDSFIDENKTYFDAQVNAANFNSPSTVTLINNWVASNTDNKITHVIDSIDSAEIMFLINATYFKGTWQYAFPVANTKDQTFYLSNGSTENTTFMIETASLKYLQNRLFTATVLPYGKGNFSMLVMVPNGTNTPQTLLNNLSPANWMNWNDSLTLEKQVTVTLPKFTMSNNFSLIPPLQSLGITDAFIFGVADFSGIDGRYDLYISDAYHYAYVSVDETGTEAAGVTVITVSEASYNPNENNNVKYLTANRPFLYFIKENTTNTILFEGIMEQP